MSRLALNGTWLCFILVQIKIKKSLKNSKSVNAECLVL